MLHLFWAFHFRVKEINCQLWLTYLKKAAMAFVWLFILKVKEQTANGGCKWVAVCMPILKKKNGTIDGWNTLKSHYGLSFRRPCNKLRTLDNDVPAHKIWTKSAKKWILERPRTKTNDNIGPQLLRRSFCLVSFYYFIQTR